MVKCTVFAHRFRVEGLGALFDETGIKPGIYRETLERRLEAQVVLSPRTL